MPHTPHERTNGIIADYCGFLREAAFVFTGLCQAPAAQRRDEFDTLVGVESDSSVTYVALLHTVADSADREWSLATGQLTRSLNATLGALVHAGATVLASGEGELPAPVLRHCRRIEKGTWAVDRSWQERRDPMDTERLLRSLHLAVTKWDWTPNGVTSPEPTTQIQSQFRALPEPLLR